MTSFKIVVPTERQRVEELLRRWMGNFPSESQTVPGPVITSYSIHYTKLYDHLSAPLVVLGFTALQLSDDRDPRAPHAETLTPDMVTLRTLITDGRLSPTPASLLESPPRIRAVTPTARAAMGYLV